MSSDRTRISYDENQQYRSVVAQQGRVTLESDFNEAQDIFSEGLRAETLDFVGSSGTPDNGYEISAATAPFDFSIKAGTMYVGGIRTTLDRDIFYSEQDQKLDWLDRDPQGEPAWVEYTNSKPKLEFIYLYLREQEVSAVEDSELKDIALGGPDTTQRTRLIQRIVCLNTSENDCEAALEGAKKQWLERGLEFDPQTMRLRSPTKLKVSFQPPTTPPDLCEPEARGGYLGAENQLIRVQISGTNKLIWGYDNASFLYRVNWKDSKTLQLQSRPVDDFHQPRKDQYVEVLKAASQLSNGEYIAASTGLITKLSAAYNPDNKQVSLTDNVANDANPLFLRIWDEEITFTPGVSVTLGKTGVAVTIQTSSSSVHIGDYWQIAVRPGEPTSVYPKRYQQDFQPPDGARIWVCPLAVINWKDDRAFDLKDCRHPFDNLVELTKRKVGGCCTVVVKPEDLKDGITLQSIIDRFANRDRPNREQITICLMPGIYELPASLKLGPQHSNMTIEACGDGAEIRANPRQLTNFLDGLIVLSYADYVTFRNLRFQLPIVPFFQADGRLTSLPKSDSFGRQFQQSLRVSIGIRPLHCALLNVHNCLFRFEVQNTTNLFAVGIFAGSECWGLQLIGNRFLHDEEYLLTQTNSFMVGYLLCPSVINVSSKQELLVVPSLLEDVLIRDNRFAGLTVAILVIADTGTVRLESNTVLQCISGFFLAPAEFVNKLDLIVSGTFLGFVLPLPNFFDPSKLVREWTGDLQKIPGFDRLSLSLHLSANDINTQVTNDRESPTLSGPSLVIAGNKSNPDSQIDTTSSVILTANKFRNKTGSEEKVTVSISNVEHCAIAGNLILNENRSDTAIEVSDVSVIAITGNIFQGSANLPPRPNNLGRWDLLNTIIS
jgi:hypothetical protein